jgi:hypothetical protein
MWKLGDGAILFCFGNNEAMQYHFREYINRNHTFLLDSHQPFICSVGASGDHYSGTDNKRLAIVLKRQRLLDVIRKLYFH